MTDFRRFSASDNPGEKFFRKLTRSKSITIEEIPKLSEQLNELKEKFAAYSPLRDKMFQR